ncbi:MAG: DUF1311 domain-containing protein [Deltaproteobacteria bacterium]|jgi:uncharacterized protein YecT (DUF1311 family)|nr:DUF1311 domain-containing protein [Deltaproteobacteria bacterium]
MSIKPFISFLTACVLFFISPVLFAQTAGLSQEFSNCIDEGGIRERARCIGNEFALQDKRLNDVYKKLMQIESEPRKQALRTAQRSWIKYKEDWSKYLALDSRFDQSIIQVEIAYFQLMATASQADVLEMEYVSYFND